MTANDAISVIITAAVCIVGLSYWGSWLVVHVYMPRMRSRFAFTEEQRQEIAEVLETVARDGLPGPRDLDVALDAIEARLQG